MNRRFLFAATLVVALVATALAGLLGAGMAASGPAANISVRAESVLAYSVIGGGLPYSSYSPYPTASHPTVPQHAFFVAPAAASIWSAPGPGVVTRETGAGGEDVYIVLLQAPSLAQYRGEVPGLAATSPTVTRASRLDTSSPASVAYLEYLEAQHGLLVGGIQQALGRSVEVTNRYDAVLNGIAVRMNMYEAAAVSRLAGVRHVERNSALELMTDNGPRWIGADAIWGEDPVTGNAPCVGNCGEGVIVGVIDTGINYDHPSFADVGGDGYDHTNPRAPLFFGVCAPPTGLPLCNDKLIGVYDFTGLGLPEDDNGHGSHTASTAAGNVILGAKLTAPTQTITRDISGVAPHANIIAYKACNSVTGDCVANGILGSINQATLDGVDVINFSIGGSSDNPWTDLNSQAFFDAYKAGIFVAASAGNSGPGFGTLGSPADAPWVTAVGASTHDRAFTKALTNMGGGATIPPPNMNGVGITAGFGPAPIVYAGDYAAQSADPANAHLCGVGTGNPATGEGEGDPWPAGTFNGEIVVCDRGEYGRVHKGENLKTAGAGGYVLANDAANGDSLVSDPHVLPAIHITFDDGVILKNWLADGGSGHTATITATELPEDAALGDVMAAFSSRGQNPSVPDVIKPDVTAPGVSIFAAWMSPGGISLPGDLPEYNVISGTSMSSPHTAGAAALVRAVNPAWTPDQVKSALMTTAFTKTPGTGSEVHGVLKEDGATPADPFDMGGGRVDLRRAADAGLVLEVGSAAYDAANPGAGGDPKTLNIASFGDNNCIGLCAWTRTLEGTADGGLWMASTTAPAGMILTVSPSSFTLNRGGTQVITVTANVADVTPKGEWTFAEVRLTPGNPAVPATHFPVAVVPVAGTSEVLHLHGNVHDGCTGNGAADLLAGCDPFMSPDPVLDTAPAARWGPIQTAVNGAAPQNVHDPNWSWVLTEPTTLQGPMVVEWWVAGPGHSPVLFNDFFIRLFADGVAVTLPDGGRVRHSGELPNVPQFLSSTIAVPEVTANTNFVLQIDPIFVNQADSFIYYDSEQPCPGGTAGPCDSRVSMPVVTLPVNDPPVANDDSAFVENGGTVVIDVLANDFDSDGDPLTVEIVTVPVNGAADVTVGRDIQYTHDGSQTTSDSLVYRITDIAGQSDTATVFITIAEECLATTGSFSDDFESRAPGWSVDTAVTNSGVWTLTADAFATSGLTSWFNDALSQEPIAGGTTKDDRLVSPPQFVSGISHLTFRHRYDFELDFDGGVLETSLDNGATWQDIEAAGGVFVAGGYDSQIDPANPDNPLQSRQAWTGASDAPLGTTMTRVDVDLGALGGNEVIFRWRLGQDALVVSTNPPFGWYIDDVAFSNLLVVDPNCIPGNEPPVANPDRASVAAGGSVTIDVKANDDDPDDPRADLTVTIETPPSHGNAEVTDGKITYTHLGDAATSDSFEYRLTDPHGASDIAAVSVRIDQPPELREGAKTTGSGWLVDVNGKKINFGFNAKETPDGFEGNLQLNDKGGGVKVHLTEVTSLGEVGANCASLSPAPNALEFQGEGTFNGVSGSRFRVCVQDNGERSSGAADRFYLECLSGCSYSTGSRTLDDAIDGGNIQVHKPTGGQAPLSTGANQAPAASGGPGGNAVDPRPATLILDPLLMTDGIVGALQLFTVTVYDQNQDLLPNAGVTLTRVTSGGFVETLTSVTGVGGVALFTVVNLGDVTEYLAGAGTAESNAIEVSPLSLGLEVPTTGVQISAHEEGSNDCQIRVTGVPLPRFHREAPTSPER